MQTSYSIDMAAATDGLLYDIGFNDIVSGIAQGAMVPGVFVTKGTTDKGVKVPAAAAEVTNPLLARGFVVRDLAKEVDASGELSYVAEDVVSVIKKGRIWVKCEDAFNQSDAVLVRITAASPNLQLGQIRVGATSNAVVLAGAKILNSGTAGQLALLEIDL